MPIGLSSSAKRESARDQARMRRLAAGMVAGANRPIWRLMNELTRKMTATRMPRVKEPWQLTQRANSGGSPKNQRGLRVRPSCSSRQFDDQEEIADHLGANGEADGAEDPEDEGAEKTDLGLPE